MVDGVYALPTIAARFARTLEVLGRARPGRLLTVSGTCGGEAAPIAWLNNRYAGKLAVLWFDAHGDLNTPQSSPSGNFNGMVLRTLLGEGPAPLLARLARPLLPEQVFLIGARDLDPAETEYLAAQPLRGYPTLASAEIDRLLAELAAGGYSHVYVHVDVDVFNSVSNKAVRGSTRRPSHPNQEILPVPSRDTRFVGNLVSATRAAGSPPGNSPQSLSATINSGGPSSTPRGGTLRRG